LSKLFGVEITHPKIMDMDTTTMNWYFYSWIEDQNEEVEKMKNFGCFVGAFHNPDMARKIQEEKTISSDEEGMNRAMELIKSDEKEKPTGARRRRRVDKRKIKLR